MIASIHSVDATWGVHTTYVDDDDDDDIDQDFQEEEESTVTPSL